MPYYMYVSLQDDDKIGIFTMDTGTGKLTPQGEVPVAGGPSPLTISPDRQVLYVGHRTVPGISSFRIHPATGALTPSGTVAPEAAPTFLSTDRTGRYVLSAYYQGAHAIQIDPSNTFALTFLYAPNRGHNSIAGFSVDA